MENLMVTKEVAFYVDFVRNLLEKEQSILEMEPSFFHIAEDKNMSISQNSFFALKVFP